MAGSLAIAVAAVGWDAPMALVRQVMGGDRRWCGGDPWGARLLDFAGVSRPNKR